jgi:hypothetical protein
MVIPELDTVKGTVICESTFHEYYTTLEEPYRFEVDGKIQSVTEGGTELKVIDRSLRRAGNGDYGNIVHFTCGYLSFLNNHPPVQGRVVELERVGGLHREYVRMAA